MKFNFAILLSVALASATAYSQTGGSAGAGATAGTGSGATGTDGPNGTGGQAGGASGGVSTSTSTSSGGSSTTASGGTSSTTSGGTGIATRPALPPPEGFPPGQPLTPAQQQQRQMLQQQTQPTQPGVQVQPGVNSQLTATGAVANPLANGNTNQFLPDTNHLAINTNQISPNLINTNLSPTSRPDLTNGMLSPNVQGRLTNANPALSRDQAISETDRRLLYQIRAAVFGPNQAAAPLAGGPIHFILRDGAVRLVGTVGSEEEKQRIENLVQQVPGVVRVFDALQVSPTGTQPATTQPTPPAGTQPVPRQPTTTQPTQPTPQ